MIVFVKRSVLILLCLVFASSGVSALDMGQWQSVKSDEARFSISMPGKVEVERGKTKSGKPVIKHKYTAGSGVTEVSYVVSYQQLNVQATKQMKDKLLSSIRQALAAKPGYTLVSQSPLSLQGASGGELVFNVKASVEVLMKMRLYFIDTRMYQVVMATSVGHEKPDDEVRFFSSFKLH